MASIVGDNVELINRKGDKVDSSVLKSKKAVGFYFSAHWCPPCRGFTPVLVEAYNNAANKDFEIVFVTSDQDEESFQHYMDEAEMPWLALPFGSPKIGEIKQKYGVRGIPTFIVVDAQGNTITASGRGDIASDKENAINKWAK